jgi:hypothetical protein
MTIQSLSDFPPELISIIAHACDETTLAAFSGTCHTFRVSYENFWMSERVAARRVFHKPELYLRFPERLKTCRAVVLNALTRAPHLLEHPSTPLAIRQDLEMQKTALVAARFLGQESFYQSLKTRNPQLNQVATELEMPVKKLSPNSELWNLQPFFLYAPWAFNQYKNVPDELKKHIDISLPLISARRIAGEALPLRLRDNEEVMARVIHVYGAYALQWASPRLRDSEAFVRSIVHRFPRSRDCVSERLKKCSIIT